MTDDCTDDEYNEENKINDVNIEELVAEEIANKMRNEHCSQGTVNKSTNENNSNNNTFFQFSPD